jgi:predicted RNase H-like HicB family nuclease
VTAQMKQTIHLVFERVDDGGWFVSCPDIPDGSALVAGDADFREARRLAREAVAFTLRGLGVDQDTVTIAEVLPDQREAL